MGFFSNILSATVKVALTPVAIVKDAVNVATGEDAEDTKDLLASAGDEPRTKFIIKSRAGFSVHLKHERRNHNGVQ